MNLAKTRDLVDIILRDPVRGPWFRTLRAFKQNKVVLVDGNEMFNRPGPRLVDALEFCHAIFEAYDHDSSRAFQIENVPFEFPWAPL